MNQTTFFSIIGGLFLILAGIIGYFLKSFHTDSKLTKKGLEDHKTDVSQSFVTMTSKMYDQRNKLVVDISAVSSKVAILESMTKSEIQSLKELNTNQFKHLGEEITDVKTSMKEVNASLHSSNDLVKQLVITLTQSMTK